MSLSIENQILKNLEGVIFDLGGTLLYLRKDPIEMHETGAKLIYKFLKSMDFKLPPEGDFVWELYKIRQHLSQKTAIELKQYTAADAMHQILKFYGLEQAANNKIIKRMVVLYFEPEMEAYETPPMAYDILHNLKKQGIKLGILSNATDHDLIVLLLKKHGLSDFFDPVVTSVSAGYPKPHPIAYESVTKSWLLKSYENIVMVGDNVDLDLTGAKRLGMKTVWIRPQRLEAYESPYADVTVSSFAQLYNIFFKKP